MINVFEAKDYKVFLRDWLTERPKRGRGESRRIAERLGVSTTLVSQVLNGEKHFTMEAVSELVDYMGLSELEADHFLLLVDHARAGSHNLRGRIKRRLDKSREAARGVKARFGEQHQITPNEAAIYYSHWAYAAIWQLIAVESGLTIDEMAARLQLPRQFIAKAIAFLLESGIVVNRDGAFAVGTKMTVIGADSPLVTKHHQNWRLQAFNRMPFKREDDFFVTAPMSLSREVAEKIRGDLPEYISKIVKWVGPSDSEVVRCLNIDWFEF